MKVIFTKALKGVAQAGDVKEVAEGYGRNFVIKNGYGIEATHKALEQHLVKQKAIQSGKQVKQALLAETIDAVVAEPITYEVLTNEKGHMWSGLHKADIAKIIKEIKKIVIPEELIHLEGVLKEVGEHTIKIDHKELTLILVSKKK